MPRNTVPPIALSESPWRSPLAQAVMLAAAGGSVFLAGGPMQGALGVFLAAAGVTMIVLPPARRVSKWNWVLGGLAVACASLSLLSAHLPSMPEWRRGLEVLPALQMAPAISVSPEETGFWLLNFAAAVMIALYILGHPVRFPATLWLAVTAALVCAAYAGLAIYASSTGWKYPFFEEDGFARAGFGFFPNRNHAATFLVTGCILCPGIIATGWKTGRWMAVLAGAAALAVSAVALLFFSSSRGGIVFLFLGLLLWLAGLGRIHSSRPLWISVFALTAMAVAFFLLSDGPARDRILALDGRHAPATQAASALPSFLPSATPIPLRNRDFRIPVYLDTLDMVKDFPITGIGFGNYAWVYPFYSRLSLREAVAIHPESDWLLLAAEAGPAALVLLLAWLLILLRTLLAQDRTTPGWPVRWGIAAAALTAIAHGLVDVPMHNAGLGWWILVLAGLGLRGFPDSRVKRGGRVVRWIFLPAGVLVFLLGAGLIHAQWFGGVPRPPFLAGATLKQIVALSREGNLAAAESAARDALNVLPMARGLYFQLGLLLYSSGATIPEVESRFAVERALDPGRPQIPYDQGWIWRGTDPIRTAELWDEAIVRHEAIHLAGGFPERPVWAIYAIMLSQAGKDADLISALGRIAHRGPMYRLLWIENPLTDKVFVWQASDDLEFLSTLDEAEKRRFLGILETRCGREALKGFLDSRSGWDDAAWPVHLRQMIAARDYATAIRAVCERYGIDLQLPSVPADLSVPPDDPAGASAYYLQRGNTVTARRILADAAASGAKDAIRLQAVLAMQEGNLPETWKHLDAFLRATGRGALP